MLGSRAYGRLPQLFPVMLVLTDMFKEKQYVMGGEWPLDLNSAPLLDGSVTFSMLFSVLDLQFSF